MTTARHERRIHRPIVHRKRVWAAVIAWTCGSCCAIAADPTPVTGTNASESPRLEAARRLLDALRAPDARFDSDAEHRLASLAQLNRHSYAPEQPVDARASAAGFPGWSDAFAGPGPREYVAAATTYQNNLVVAGMFGAIGGRPIRHVARLRDGVWDPLGNGVSNQYFTALFSHGGVLYAASSASTSYPWYSLQHFDGVGWRGDDAPYWVGFTDVAQGNGGVLLMAGRVAPWSNSARAIYEWTPTWWERSRATADFGADREVDRLERIGPSLYVAGRFESFGAKPARNIARMNLPTTGLGVVSALGDGLNARVRDLITFEGQLVAAGDFTHSGVVLLNHVARWDGSAWQQLGEGLDGDVLTLALRQGQLLAGGRFTTAGGRPARGLAFWNGESWSELAGGVHSPPEHLWVIGDDLLLSGSPLPLQLGPLFFGLCRWDGMRWGLFGQGLDAPVTDLQVVGDLLVAVGAFELAGYTYAHHVAGWDGTQWRNLGSGTPGRLSAAVVHEGILYVGGSVAASVSASEVDRVARYDGSQFVPLTHGPDGPVLAMLSHSSGLIAGGAFEHAGLEATRNIARWDGASWLPLGSGVAGTVYALAAHDGDLIVGGEFDIAGSEPVRNIAAWDGSSWRDLGGGLTARVECLAVHQGRLYAGGLFTGPAGQAPRGLAYLDNGVWRPVAGGVDGFVLALHSTGHALVVGGWFAPAADGAAPNLAVYGEVGWRGLPAAPDGWVDDIAEFQGGLYVAGGFRRAGDQASAFVAHYVGELPAVDASPVPAPTPQLVVAEPTPNPFNPRTTVRFELLTRGHVRIRVFDARGRLVRRIVDALFAAGSHRAQWDGNDDAGRPSASGSYSVRVDLDGRQVAVRKAVLLR